MSLPHGKIRLKRTLWFFNGYARFNKNTYYFQNLAANALKRIITPLFFTLDMFDLVAAYLFDVSFVKNMTS